MPRHLIKPYDIKPETNRKATQRKQEADNMYKYVNRENLKILKMYEGYNYEL